MSISVTVTDSETGQSETREVPEDDYFILCVGKCYVEYTQAYKNGTHQLTIKGRKPGL
jgi:hypothetical protein